MQFLRTGNQSRTEWSPAWPRLYSACFTKPNRYQSGSNSAAVAVEVPCSRRNVTNWPCFCVPCRLGDMKLKEKRKRHTRRPDVLFQTTLQCQVRGLINIWPNLRGDGPRRLLLLQSFSGAYLQLTNAEGNQVPLSKQTSGLWTVPASAEKGGRAPRTQSSYFWPWTETLPLERHSSLVN